MEFPRSVVCGNISETIIFVAIYSDNFLPYEIIQEALGNGVIGYYSKKHF